MTNFESVKKFMQTFGQEVKIKAIFPNDKITKLRLDLIREELSELEEAIEKKDIKEIIIPTKLKAIKNCGQEILFADSGYFDNSTKKLTLTGNVRMLKDGNVLVTDKLIYSAKFEGISSQGDEK